LREHALRREEEEYRKLQNEMLHLIPLVQLKQKECDRRYVAHMREIKKHIKF
jgi:hypothetical protein